MTGTKLRPPTRSVAPTGRPPRQGKPLLQQLVPYLFAAPSIAVVTVILAVPVVYGFYKSLYRAEFFGGDEEFVGLDNYSQLMQDPAFQHAFVKTSIFVGGCIVLSTVLGLFFAFALHNVIRQLRFVRAFSIAPYLISSVAAAVMFRMLFNAEFGLINRMLGLVGIDGLRWLSDPNLAMVTVILCQVWTDLPLTILLLLGGLQTIDSGYLDAALVDGASGLRRSLHISIPLIMPQLVLSTIWMSYSTLTGLGTILALTGGGPIDATRTIPLEMYFLAFDQLRTNEALAVATALLVLNAGLTLVYYLFGRRFDIDAS